MNASLIVQVDGKPVTLDGDALTSILHKMIYHRMFTFHVNLPGKDDVVVTPSKKLKDWAWLEVSTANAFCNEYEDGIEIELFLTDALDGGLKEKESEQ
jgi:hypothetical protein